MTGPISYSGKELSRPQAVARQSGAHRAASCKPRVELGKRFGEIAPTVAEANMPRLVVNRAGKKQHASLTYSAFAEILNVPLRFEMREADRARVWRRPVE